MRSRRDFAGRDLSALLLVVVLAASGAGCKIYKEELIAAPAGTTVSAASQAVDAGAQDASVTESTAFSPPTTFDPSTCANGDCWWSKGPDTCRAARVPLVGERPTAPPDELRVSDIYLGMVRVRLGTSDAEGNPSETAWEDLGLDLDGLCTNSSSCDNNGMVSCRSPGPAIPYDGKLCRDNTFARLQAVIAVGPEVSTRLGLTEPVFNCHLWRGTFNMIARLRDYNGSGDDEHVRVDYYLSTGLEEGDQASWTCPDVDYARFPRWGTNRRWRIDESTLMEKVATPGALPDSPFADANAYVHNQYLVARVPNGAQQGFMGDGQKYRGFMFKPSQGVYIGRLQQAKDKTWELSDGLISGRVGQQELVTAFHESGFCESEESHTFYQNMKHFVDDMADTLVSGDTDPNMSCDALSYAIGFEAVQLTPGKSEKAPPRVLCCEPGRNLEDCLATCGDGQVTGQEKCDSAIATGGKGACPSSCPPAADCAPQVVSGTGCAATCVPMPVSMAGARDGCCPSGGSVSSDADCDAVCGNGVIEAGETCDPPESCGSCTLGAADRCFTVMATGSAESCNLRCDYDVLAACRSGDDCCPMGCNSGNDNDCSTSCQNNMLEPVETCDANTERPCAGCDDGDPCTEDLTSGSADGCKQRCLHVKISQALSGDGCCLPSTSANADADCAAVCGNGVVEADEECDDGNKTAGDGCANCDTESLQDVCLANEPDDECARCTCASCTRQAVGCYVNDSRGEVRRCRDLVECAGRTRCSNPDCFCGDASFFSCLAGEGTGPCREEIVAAAGSPSLVDIEASSSDLNSPLGRGNQLYPCIERNCAEACARRGR